MSYVYLKSQGEECYTVGFYGPVGEDWHAESDHPTSEEAARRVHWLNGGSDHTGGSDHMQFIRVGLPGFQFIQDDLEFFTTTFHTNQDFYDRLVAEDLMQASVILASFAYNAAMRDEKIPRTENQRDNNRRWHK